MADPIVFDDGGSTRIKRLVANGVGSMEGLLDLDPNTNPPQSTATVPGPFSQVRIVSLDITGTAQTDVTIALANGDNFEIDSENNQVTLGAIGAGGKCTLTLQGAQNNAPLVEAKQFNKKRRYVVANAGSIQQVSVKGIAQLNAAAKLYTTVILS